MRNFFKPSLWVGLSLLGTWSFSANAVVMTCGDFQLGDSSACELGTGNNDPYPQDLTAFGVTWESIDKDDAANVMTGNDPDTGSPESWFWWTFEGDGEPTSGDWFLDAAVWGTYDRLVIVLKASDTFAAFELEPEDLTGTWALLAHALSHASLYGIVGDDEPPPVAEPGT